MINKPFKKINNCESWEKQNYEFWKNQVKKHGYDVKSTNFDLLAEELELFYLEKFVNDGEVICDLGCGNGRIIIELAKKKQNTIFYGFDFVEEMVDVANEQKEKFGLRNVFFYEMSVCSEDLRVNFSSMFDKVMTKRLLINLKGDIKLKAVKNIYSILKDYGIYVMVECFIEPLAKINSIRKKLNLSEIKVKRFNQYLSKNIMKQIEVLFEVKKQIDFESFYYFMSRIFNAYLSVGEPDYLSPINKLAIELTKTGVRLVEDYSPEKIIILQKLPHKNFRSKANESTNSK
jgi:ubiquinone/menaquinone biosynthesis C-methylase UbiE